MGHPAEEMMDAVAAEHAYRGPAKAAVKAAMMALIAP
jgi:hypothetical protein